MTQSTEQQGHPKEAGALVYLQEELGDARMRCDQLLRYVDKASKLIEQSSHKDHFFEVAGDVVRGIPETLFKLHKALEAVALAANRIDYEEIKQDLRPEKVEELERVLKDVRVRQVQRRSLPMLNPASVVQQLKGLAKKARSEGRLDTETLSSLIASLEAGAPKVASATTDRVAAELEAMAHALENPPEGEQPSRIRLAQVLRRQLATHLDLTKKAADAEDKQSRFEEGKPADPTENMSKEDAKEWKAQNDEHKDNFKSADMGEPSNPSGIQPTDASELTKILDTMTKDARRALLFGSNGDYKKMFLNLMRVIGDFRTACFLFEIPEVGISDRLIRMLTPYTGGAKPMLASEDEDKQSRYEEGKSADPTENMSEADAKAWKDNTEEHKDKFKKNAAKPPEGVTSQINDAIVQLKKISQGSGNPKTLLTGAFTSLSDALTKMGQDEALENLIDRLNATIRSKWSQKDWMEAEKEKTAASDEKQSRYEEGKSADPTENMSEGDAKAWKDNTEKHKDKFKSAGVAVLSWKA